MKQTGKKFLLFGILCMAVLLCGMPVNAANHINMIQVEATIQQDGSMDVVQYWEGDFDEGTENYIPIKALSGITIHDLQVSDEE
ncbi:MAG: hypothetical protein PHE02_03570 [Lachnospiraceae bacterium]|nr:hypothetical protein [Lachnospiraceae bacterium]